MTEESENTLPENVREALSRGNKIEAIKRLRKETGMDLKQAKDTIDHYPAGAPKPQAQFDAASVAEALKEGRTIEAIKRLRAQTGMGLKEAKTMIDDMQKDLGIEPTPHRFRVPWLIPALVAAGLVIYYVIKTKG